MLTEEFVLEPADGYFGSYGFEHQYHTRVRDIRRGDGRTVALHFKGWRT